MPKLGFAKKLIAAAAGGDIGTPTVSGTSSVGSVLTAVLPTGIDATSYQWTRDGVNISGATSATYTLVTADLGKTVAVKISGISIKGSGVSVAPAPVVLRAGVQGFGDSTMVDISGDTGVQMAAANRALNIYATARGLTVFNSGISGTLLQDTNDSNGSPRAFNGFGRYQADTLGANATAELICNLGLNDARWSRHVLATYIAEYTTMVQAWKAAGIVVTLASPGWIPDAGYGIGSTVDFQGSTRTIHETLVAAVWQIAKNEGVKYAPVYERMKAVGASTVGADSIHRTISGSAVAAQAYLDAAVPTESSWPGASGAPAPAPAPDTTAPSFVSAVIANATPTKIVVTYNETLSATVTGSATVTVNGTPRTVNSSTVVGSTIEHTLASAASNGDVVLLTQPSGHVRDTASTPNVSAVLTAITVTNNVAAAAPPPAPGAGTAVTFSERSANLIDIGGAGSEIYGSDAGSTVYNGIGLVTGVLAEGVNGWIEAQYPDNTTAGAVLTFDPVGGLPTYGTNDFMAHFVPSGVVLQGSNVTTTSATLSGGAHTLTPSATTRLRLRRDAAGTVTIETTTDNGSNWTLRHTFSGTSTGALYARAYTSQARRLNQVRQSGIA